ncbi:MAG: TetR/AcrR family transcriptional regulator [Chloroflexi bacterium]|nr:TetR/AcrR family transcriptional regulator [Chloroflexota bacterium]
MASQILDVAERLVQQRGFNGFSYADIAAELHVTKAALHYHFAGKAELGDALIARYAARFAAALDDLDAADLDAPAKLEGYAKLYLEVLRNQRMCMCGMLAAEYQTLPERMQTAVIDFFNANETWLERVVEQGQCAGTLRQGDSARDIARAIVGGFEGAMLLARPYGDISRFQAGVRPLLAGLVAEPRINHRAARTPLRRR